MLITFSILHNHPEWQRDCGMGPPQDMMVVALEKEKSGGRNRNLKCCCSSGQCCTRLNRVRDSTELREHFQAPGAPWKQNSRKERAGKKFPCCHLHPPTVL